MFKLKHGQCPDINDLFCFFPGETELLKKKKKKYKFAQIPPKGSKFRRLFALSYSD